MKIKSSKGEILTVPDGMEEDAFKAQAEGRLSEFADQIKQTMKSGGMIKRKDGSYSRRGLWDNIRANRGSGKKPTKEMLRQEAKIRARKDGGGPTQNPAQQIAATPQPLPSLQEINDWNNLLLYYKSTGVDPKTLDTGDVTTRMYNQYMQQHPDFKYEMSPFVTKMQNYYESLQQNPHSSEIGGVKRYPEQELSDKDAWLGSKTSQYFIPTRSSYVSNPKSDTSSIFIPNPYASSKEQIWQPVQSNQTIKKARGGKLGQGVYNMGIMPYGNGGYTMGNMNPDGMIHVPYGYGTSAYNERYDLGGWVTDAAKMSLNNLAAPLEQISGNNFVNFNYENKAMADAAAVTEGLIGGATDVAGSVLAGPAYGWAKSGIQMGTKNLGHSQEEQRGANKWANKTGQIASSAGNLASGIVSGNTAQIVGGAGQLLGTTGQQLGSKELAVTGQLAGMGSQFVNPAAGNGNSFFKMPTPQMGSPLGNMMAQYGGAVKMDDGGQTGMVPINVEGAAFNQGSGPDAKKGELLVKNGKIIKNYVGRPPHPLEGQNPMGDDEAPEGLIVIPKNRTAEYLEAGSEKRKQIESSLISQQQDREMKKMKRPSKKMGDGGYYSFGMGDMGMAHGGMAYSDQLGGHDFAAYGGPIGNPEHIDSLMGYGYKKGGWIQKATASIKRRGTEGVCTGSKFGGPGCPPGSRRYNLAKTFRKMAKARKHEHGGMIDPVTGSHNLMYAEGGQLPESLLRTRMRASGASPEEINNYVAAHYADGGETYNVMPSDATAVRYPVNMQTQENLLLSPTYDYASRIYNAYSDLGQSKKDWMNYVMKNKTNPNFQKASPADWYSEYSKFKKQGASKYEMGGATNVTHDFPIRRLRYDKYSVTGGPNLTSSGPFTASAPYTTMGPPTYQDWSSQQSNITAPGFDGSGNYTANLGNLGPATTPSYIDRNYGNMAQDLAGLAPVLYNFGRGIFEKPEVMDAQDYMTPEMKFEATKISEEPYRQTTSRALYNSQMGLAGRAATAAQMAQARASGMQDWRNKEALRRQSVGQMNSEIAARNKAMQLQIDVMNQQARGQRGEFFREGTEQLAQNFGRNPMYYQAMMGKFRQPFTGWEAPKARKGGKIYR